MTPDQVQLAILEQLVAIRRLLDGGQRGPRDDADRALVMAIRTSIADRVFTSSELIDRADRVDPALKRALLDADVETSHDAGIWMRRMHGTTAAGFAVERVGERRDGVLWSVTMRG